MKLEEVLMQTMKPLHKAKRESQNENDVMSMQTLEFEQTTDHAISKVVVNNSKMAKYNNQHLATNRHKTTTDWFKIQPPIKTIAERQASKWGRTANDYLDAEVKLKDG